MRTPILIVLFLAACRGGTEDDLVAEAERMRDAACACKGDQECLAKAVELEHALQRKLRAKYRRDEDVPQSLRDRLSPIYARWSDCTVEPPP